MDSLVVPMELSEKRAKRKASASKRKAKRMRKALNVRSKRKRDRVQDYWIKKYGRILKGMRPELKYYEFASSSDVAIAAYASLSPDSAWYMCDPAYGIIDRDTEGDDDYIGNEVKPTSEHWKLSFFNTSATADTLLIYVVWADIGRMDNNLTNTFAELKTQANPKAWIHNISAAMTGDTYAYLTSRFFKKPRDQVLASTNEQDKFKLSLIKRIHIPGNTNGHRPHHKTVSLNLKFHPNARLRYPDDVPANSQQYALVKGKYPLVFMTTKNGTVSFQYSHRFYYYDN